jgi:uncharacterized membrane protein YphA (DoxX/SURF4 family)
VEDIALLILRLVLGGIFVAHGAQKLFGSFGGHGLKGTAGFFEQIGLKRERPHAHPAQGPRSAREVALRGGSRVRRDRAVA